MRTYQALRGTVLAQENKRLRFERLSATTLNAAIAVANKAFPHDRYNLECPEIEYRAALEPKRYRTELRQLGLDAQQHWIVRSSDDIVGITGLQHKTGEHPSDRWLGWFCVEENARGYGVGKYVLNWTMNVARNMGCRTLRLWTTDTPNEAHAQVLYDRFGFLVYRVEPYQDGYVRIYRERQL